MDTYPGYSANEDNFEIFNVFVARGSNDDVEYDSLCNHYNTTNSHVRIMDPNENLNNMTCELCKNVLMLINESKLFIAILTPSNVDDSIRLNSNVLLELGYALSCKDLNNILIFVKDDENYKKDFERLRPSMLSHITYNTYIDYESFIHHIQTHECEVTHEDSITDYIIADSKCISLIKFEFSKLLLLTNIDIQTKISQINYYFKNYQSYEVTELFYLFINEYINTNQLDYQVTDYFIYLLYTNILDYTWIDNKNNQVKILSVLKLIKYRIFDKFKLKNNKHIIKNRRNFAISLFELLKSNKFYYNDHVKKILDESVYLTNDINYELYIYKLNKLYNGGTKTQNYYEDTILYCKSKYNSFIIKL